MLQEQLIEEIKQIPNDKLAEVYDLIHYFRLGLLNEKKSQNKQSQLSFSQRWQGQFKINDSTNDARLDYLKQRYQL